MFIKSKAASVELFNVDSTLYYTPKSPLQIMVTEFDLFNITNTRCLIDHYFEENIKTEKIKYEIKKNLK